MFFETLYIQLPSRQVYSRFLSQNIFFHSRQKIHTHHGQIHKNLFTELLPVARNKKAFAKHPSVTEDNNLAESGQIGSWKNESKKGVK